MTLKKQNEKLTRENKDLKLKLAASQSQVQLLKETIDNAVKSIHERRGKR